MILLDTGCLMCLNFFVARGAERSGGLGKTKHFIESVYKQHGISSSNSNVNVIHHTCDLFSCESATTSLQIEEYV